MFYTMTQEDVMAQEIKNNSVHQTPLPLLCKKSKLIFLILVDLTAAQQVGKPAGRPNIHRFENS